LWKKPNHSVINPWNIYRVEVSLVFDIEECTVLTRVELLEDEISSRHQKTFNVLEGTFEGQSVI
jgi:hypothetical protein